MKCNRLVDVGRRQFLRAAAGLSAVAAGQGASHFSAPLAMSLTGLAALARPRAPAGHVCGPGRALGGRVRAGGTLLIHYGSPVITASNRSARKAPTMRWLTASPGLNAMSWRM